MSIWWIGALFLAAITQSRDFAASYAAPDTVEDYNRLISFSRCLVKRYPKEVSLYLSHYAFEANYKRLTAASIKPECLDFGQLKAGEGQLRGALAFAVLESKMDVLPETYTTYSRLSYGAPIEAEDLEKKRAYVNLYKASECVVRDAGSRARTFLKSRPASIEEDGMLVRLRASWQTCSGEPFAFNSFAMRGLVAETVYKFLDSASGAKRSEAQ